MYTAAAADGDAVEELTAESETVDVTNLISTVGTKYRAHRQVDLLNSAMKTVLGIGLRIYDIARGLVRI